MLHQLGSRLFLWLSDNTRCAFHIYTQETSSAVQKIRSLNVPWFMSIQSIYTFLIVQFHNNVWLHVLFNPVSMKFMFLECLAINAYNIVGVCCSLQCVPSLCSCSYIPLLIMFSTCKHLSCELHACMTLSFCVLFRSVYSMFSACPPCFLQLFRKRCSLWFTLLEGSLNNVLLMLELIIYTIPESWWSWVRFIPTWKFRSFIFHNNPKI